MNNDGWGFLGAGTSDNRIAGEDLQHNRQKNSGGEYKAPVRMKHHLAESGGPMKEAMKHMSEGAHEKKEHHMHAHLKEEKERHDGAMRHHEHHLARHHGRHFNSQHGHDHYK